MALPLEIPSVSKQLGSLPMPKRNWWRRLCHDFLARSRRLPRSPLRIRPRFELLEDRVTPGQLHVDGVSIFATASGSPTPVEGEWVTARVDFTTTNLDVADSYAIVFRLDGSAVSMTNTPTPALWVWEVSVPFGKWVHSF